MKKLLIITPEPSELSALLTASLPTAEIRTPDEAEHEKLADFDAFCLLGSSGKSPLLLRARLRAALEAEHDAGKRFFCEYVTSFACMYADKPAETSHHRLLATEDFGGVEAGSVLDDQNNRFLQPYFAPASARPLLFYRDYIAAHDHAAFSAEEAADKAHWGLWFYDETLLLCSFCLANPGKARLTPGRTWEKVLGYIFSWLTETHVTLSVTPVYMFRRQAVDVGEVIARGMHWFSGAEIVVDGGAGGVREGLRHAIQPDGKQLRADGIRTDCAGETAAAYLLYGLLRHDAEALRISRALEGFVYGPMQVHGGKFDGMLRWTTEAWEVCYQDDAARAMFVTFYRALFTGETEYVAQACRALDFLISTTGTDGLRPSRTDTLFLNDAVRAALREKPCGVPSAHYNAWYHAILLLAYHVTAKKEYFDTACRGLESILAAYPDTAREQSETEEQARLILPLALLYSCTGKAAHRAMLDRVAADLEAHRHPFGGIREWDTGYQAAFSVRKRGGECSLLAENGNPVADLLYSQNWLPAGYAFAYAVTGDTEYRRRRDRQAEFFARTQLLSENSEIDGAWARCFDMDRREVFGVPHDGGWGPWAVESGWTVAEILTGLMLPDLLAESDFSVSKGITR